eukprot:NODE_100_length_20331_cov_1.214462.p1 type:complete len:757 gc:universal NODE_100_length_20331_cov_1.214462:11003-8733(-)
MEKTFQSSPLRKELRSSSPSPTKSPKTPAKSSDERLKLLSPKPNELQNIQLVNLKRNHFLKMSPSQPEILEKENLLKSDLTDLIDPTTHAMDIIENTNIFKKKKRRVTFQDSPSKKSPTGLKSAIERKPIYQTPTKVTDEQLFSFGNIDPNSEFMENTNLLLENKAESVDLLTFSPQVNQAADSTHNYSEFMNETNMLPEEGIVDEVTTQEQNHDSMRCKLSLLNSAKVEPFSSENLRNQNQSLMEETQVLLAENQSKSNDLLDSFMEQTQILHEQPSKSNADMETTNLLKSENAASSLPMKENASVLFDETNLLTKTLPQDVQITEQESKSVFNMDEIVALHNRRGPLETSFVPGGSILNSMIDTTIEQKSVLDDTNLIPPVPKPVVDTSSFFKKIEANSFYSESSISTPTKNVPRNILSPKDESLLNDEIPLESDNSLVEKSLSELIFENGPMDKVNMEISTVEEFTCSKLTVDVISSAVYADVVNLNIPQCVNYLEKYESLSLEFLELKSEITSSNLCRDYHNADRSEKEYLEGMIKNTTSFCKMIATDSKLQQKIKRADAITMLYRDKIESLSETKLKLDSFIDYFCKLEIDFDNKIESLEIELKEQVQNCSQNYQHINDFEKDVSEKINMLDGDIDSGEKRMLKLNNAIENAKYELSRQEDIILTVKKDIDRLNSQITSLKVVEENDVDLLFQQQLEIKQNFGWELLQIDQSKILLDYSNSFGVEIQYSEHYSCELVHDYLDVKIKVPLFN